MYCFWRWLGLRLPGLFICATGWETAALRISRALWNRQTRFTSHAVIKSRIFQDMVWMKLKLP